MNSPIIIRSEQSQNSNLADLETKKALRPPPDPSNKVPRKETETKEMKRPSSEPLHPIFIELRREIRRKIRLKENTFEIFRGSFHAVKKRQMGDFFINLKREGIDLTKDHLKTEDLESKLKEVGIEITLCPYTRKEILEMGAKGEIVVEEKRNLLLKDIGNVILFTKDGRMMTGEVFMHSKTLKLYDFPDEYK